MSQVYRSELVPGNEVVGVVGTAPLGGGICGAAIAGRTPAVTELIGGMFTAWIEVMGATLGRAYCCTESGGGGPRDVAGIKGCPAAAAANPPNAGSSAGSACCD